MQPCITSERQLVYEVFGLVGTHIENPRRIEFTKIIVCGVKDSISIALKRDVLENTMSSSLQYG